MDARWHWLCDNVTPSLLLLNMGPAIAGCHRGCLRDLCFSWWPATRSLWSYKKVSSPRLGWMQRDRP